MTRQPNWKLVANLGDASPIDYGGAFVYEDTTGVYPPELEVLESPESDDGKWTVYRFICEPCTFENGILSDNPYHKDKAVWFSDDIGSICNSCDVAVATFIDMICNGNTLNRAMAWQTVGMYFGYHELDSYPLTFKSRAEVEARYADELSTH